MNKLFNQGVLIFRRLSVFYMFFVFLLLAFILYQYKVRPDNEDELQNRGQRVLKQLVENFTEKDKGLKAIFNDTSVTAENLLLKEENLEKLNENVPYTVLNFHTKNAGFKVTPVIRINHEFNWELVYTKYAKHDSLEISVTLTDFAKNLFSVREDIFNSFLLVLDTPANGRNLPVIYAHDNTSASPFINLDTLRVLQKNSDLSAVTDISISRNKFKIFICPFRYYNQQVLLAGLIAADSYSKQVTTTPLTFIPLFIISILLLLIFLPFLKLFFLSLHESVTITDLRTAAISMYAGSAIFVLIVFYILSNVSLKNSYDEQLLQEGNLITTDIKQEIDLANKDLNRFDNDTALINNQPLQNFLAYRNLFNADAKDSIGFDSLLTPLHFKNASRVFWFDSLGRTLAKWNAFDFVVPLTPVNELDFFKRLRDKYPKDTQSNYINQPVQMYCGKSNATNEFQVLFSKPSNRVIQTLSNALVKSYGICMAGFISCSNRSIVPPGFGFCVIDNSGEVLIHSDARRNLSENIIKESENSISLSSARQNKNGNYLCDIRLYGEEMEASVMPIKNHPLYVVTYYDKKIISNQILVAIQFAALIFITTYMCVLLCLLFATYSTKKPVQLFFKITNIEWIRPSRINNQAYTFTISYFIMLAILYLLFVVTILRGNYNLTTIVYLSVLLPFYTVLGYILARKKNIFYRKKETGIVVFPLAFIFIINFFIILFKINSGSPSVSFTEFLPMLFFQVLSFLILFIRYNYHKWFERNYKTYMRNQLKKEDQVSPDAVYKKYFHSLGFSIFLISLFPVSGLLIYSWSAQNIQIKKNSLLQLAVSFEDRSSYFKNEMLQDYKSVVSKNLSASNFFDSLAFAKGIYFPQMPQIKPVSIPDSVNINEQPENGDRLFYTLNEHLPVSGNTSPIPLQDAASDNSWQFSKDKNNRQLLLTYTNADTSIGEVPVTISIVSKNLYTRICNAGCFLVFVILLIMILIYLGRKLIKEIIARLFLQYADADRINIDRHFLSGILQASAPGKSYLKKILIPHLVTVDFFQLEWHPAKEPDLKKYSIEEVIIAMTDCFSQAYETIWQSLSPEEQYILFGFAKYRLTNYKNADILFRLLRKGILTMPFGMLDFFAPSFRNYILGKAGTKPIEELNSKYALPGVWSSIKVPVLSLMAVIGIFILITQSEVTNRITGFFASIAALFPLLLSLFNNRTAASAKSGDDNKTASA